MSRGFLASLALVTMGCSSSSSHSTTPPPTPASKTQVNMTFERAGKWLTAPFPSDDLRGADGLVDFSAFPNPEKLTIVSQLESLIAQAHGFSQNGGVFFSLTGTLDSSKLPTLDESVGAGSPVFLIGVDAKAPDLLVRYPVNISFATDGGPYGSSNLLSVVPLQGRPLRPGTTYAAVVLRSLGDAKGLPLGVSTSMSALAQGKSPAGMPASAYAEYASALATLAKAHVAAADIAGISVFTTDMTLAEFQTVKNAILSLPVPKPTAAWVQDTQCTDGSSTVCNFPTFCVYKTTIGMPDYQSGTPPYTSGGGAWALDAAGKPVVQQIQPSYVYATVPRTAMPKNGFPTSVFIRTGAGGNRPIVDRGMADSATYDAGGAAVTPGTGPALYFAREGFAGLQVDGPLGGLRNPMNWNEDFAIFNVGNLPALRDNVRESAVELVLFASIAQSLSFDASDCEGFSGGPVKFDLTHGDLMGHSMGSTISPLAFSFQPTYKTLILSGAGASWMANLLYKELPVPVLPLVDLLLEYSPMKRELTMGDPMLSMIQWALDPADPLNYTDFILNEPMDGGPPRDVLMEQGIVDHYILPPIANGTSLSLGLDLGGKELDDTVSALSQFTPLGELLRFSGRKVIALPAQGNWVAQGGTKATALVIQHPSDGIEDGHEIVFQTDPPKHEYECFLASSLTGVPTVPNGGDPDSGCP
jgi:hypothetical protein